MGRTARFMSKKKFADAMKPRPKPADKIEKYFKEHPEEEISTPELETRFHYTRNELRTATLCLMRRGIIHRTGSHVRYNAKYILSKRWNDED